MISNPKLIKIHTNIQLQQGGPSRIKVKKKMWLLPQSPTRGPLVDLEPICSSKKPHISKILLCKRCVFDQKAYIKSLTDL